MTTVNTALIHGARRHRRKLYQ